MEIVVQKKLSKIGRFGKLSVVFSVVMWHHFLDYPGVDILQLT